MSHSFYNPPNQTVYRYINSTKNVTVSTTKPYNRALSTLTSILHVSHSINMVYKLLVPTNYIPLINDLKILSKNFKTAPI